MANKNKFVSMRTRLAVVLCIALLSAAAVFGVVNETGRFLIWRYYLADGTREDRVDEYIEDFQQYVWENKLYVDDSDKISEWREGKYVDIIVYKDESLMYAPNWFKDFEQVADKSTNPFFNSPWISGDRGIEQYLTEEAKINYLKELDDILEGNRELSPVIFVDGTLLVTVVDYTEDFLYVGVLVMALACAVVVLAIIISFHFAKMTRRINHLAHNVKLVEGGNLELPIEAEGNDEITALARDVNSMRNSVVDNMTKEKQAWEANSALITAMSHDIRTPLTVVLGYLDLIELQNEDPSNLEYISACKEHTMRLKAMSDDMFSYFLVFGKQEGGLENATMQSADVLRQMIAEHTLLLIEKGYVFETVDNAENCEIYADTMYLGRVVGNIFSNIEKYADPAEKVRISFASEDGSLAVSFANAVKRDDSKPESNHIGIKTCERIMEKMKGSFASFEENGRFTAKLSLASEFPLQVSDAPSVGDNSLRG